MAHTPSGRRADRGERLDREPLARPKQSRLDLRRLLGCGTQERLAGLVQECGSASQGKVGRAIRAPVNGHRDLWPQAAYRFGSAPRVEVLSAAQRSSPPPDRHEGHVEVRNEAVHSRKETGVAGEEDAPRAQDRVAQGCRFRPERSAPVVLGVSRANYDVSDTDLVALDDLRHVCEATDLTPESTRHDDVHLVVEHAQ